MVFIKPECVDKTSENSPNHSRYCSRTFTLEGHVLVTSDEQELCVLFNHQ
jgi:hypothetical protein